MSHINYSFNQTDDSLPRDKMKLRNIASTRYSGDWPSIPHSHSYAELFYIVDGAGQFQINDKLFPVQAHQLVVVTVKRYIDHHYKENLTLDELAEKVSISKYHMAHAFKREYGVSPINYIIDCRIREGKRLLAETDLAPSQIASILGFSSSSYFCKTFSNIEGTSPTEYRKANQVKF